MSDVTVVSAIGDITVPLDQIYAVIKASGFKASFRPTQVKEKRHVLPVYIDLADEGKMYITYGKPMDPRIHQYFTKEDFMAHSTDLHDFFFSYDSHFTYDPKGQVAIPRFKGTKFLTSVMAGLMGSAIFDSISKIDLAEMQTMVSSVQAILPKIREAELNHILLSGGAKVAVLVCTGSIFAKNLQGAEMRAYKEVIDKIITYSTQKRMIGKRCFPNNNVERWSDSVFKIWNNYSTLLSTIIDIYARREISRVSEVTQAVPDLLAKTGGKYTKFINPAKIDDYISAHRGCQKKGQPPTAEIVDSMKKKSRSFLGDQNNDIHLLCCHVVYTLFKGAAEQELLFTWLTIKKFPPEVVAKKVAEMKDDS